jgi:hypothetical protein
MGCEQKEIARKFARPQSTISTTIFRNENRENQKSLPRKGRPRLLTSRDERSILRYARSAPKISYRQIKKAVGIQCCNKTLQRLLARHNIVNWRAKKRPLLTEEHAQKRLQWANKYKDWTREDWAKVVWSDECSVERGSGERGTEWCFRTPQQKWNKEMIQTRKKGKDHCYMIWAAFWGSEKSDIYSLERDFEAKKRGYSAASYLAVLDQNLLGIYEPGLIFMQDNAPIHTARAVLAWFEEYGINVMEWPPYSPDLNPIEHLWFRLKELVNELHPELKTMSGDYETVKKVMIPALQSAWEAIPEDLIYCLLDSMTTRVNAIIEAKGWYTRF